MDHANPYLPAESPQPYRPATPPSGNLAVAIIALVLAAGALTGVGYYRHYVASATHPEAIVHLHRVAQTILPSESPKYDSNEFERYRHTQANLIVSNPVLVAALRRPQVRGLSSIRDQSDPLGWLAKSLVVDLPDNSEHMLLWLEGGKADEQPQILNAVATEYVEFANSNVRRMRGTQVDQLRVVIKQHEDECTRGYRDLQAIEQAAGRDSADYELLSRKLVQNKRIVDELTQQLARLEVELHAPPRVNLVQEAMPPAD